VKGLDINLHTHTHTHTITTHTVMSQLPTQFYVSRMCCVSVRERAREIINKKNKKKTASKKGRQLLVFFHTALSLYHRDRQTNIHREE
jgi:hypothetical protein